MAALEKKSDNPSPRKPPGPTPLYGAPTSTRANKQSKDAPKTATVVPPTPGKNTHTNTETEPARKHVLVVPPTPGKNTHTNTESEPAPKPAPVVPPTPGKNTHTNTESEPPQTKPKVVPPARGKSTRNNAESEPPQLKPAVVPPPRGKSTHTNAESEPPLPSRRKGKDPQAKGESEAPQPVPKEAPPPKEESAPTNSEPEQPAEPAPTPKPKLPSNSAFGESMQKVDLTVANDAKETIIFIIGTKDEMRVTTKVEGEEGANTPFFVAGVSLFRESGAPSDPPPHLAGTLEAGAKKKIPVNCDTAYITILTKPEQADGSTLVALHRKDVKSRPFDMKMQRFTPSQLADPVEVSEPPPVAGTSMDSEPGEKDDDDAASQEFRLFKCDKDFFLDVEDGLLCASPAGTSLERWRLTPDKLLENSAGLVLQMDGPRRLLSAAPRNPEHPGQVWEFTEERLLRSGESNLFVLTAESLFNGRKAKPAMRRSRRKNKPMAQKWSFVSL